MLTETGKFLRKLRIDRGELLKNMADKLGVSSSFLSAVENGKKKMPPDWKSTIIKLYQLNDIEIFNWDKAIAQTANVVEMDIKGMQSDHSDIAVAFARQFPDFTDDELKIIKNILERRRNANKQ